MTNYQQAVQSSSTSGKLDPSRSREPSQVPRQVIEAATIAPEIQGAAQSGVQQNAATLQHSWIYLGATSSGKWIEKTKTVAGDTIPAQLKNQTIVPKTDIFRRSDLPKLVNGEWKLGDIKGVLAAQQHVVVQDIRSVPGVNNTELWWAWIAP